MFKSKALALLLILVVFVNAFSYSEEPGKHKNILVLFAYVPSSPAYRPILDGIRTHLTKEFADDYSLHTEYLEIERYPFGNYPKERFDLYNQKYDSINLDLLICVGINVIPTIRQYASIKLQSLPVISFDYDFSSYGIPSDLSLNQRTAIFNLKVDADSTIAFALSLFPKTQNIYFICGVSPGDKLFYKVSKEAAVKFAGHKNITFITDVAMDEVLKMVRHLPENSIILMPSFITDSKQVPYSNIEAARLISKAANAPLFTYNDMGFGDGTVGGYILSFKKAGLAAGEAAVKILEGADPNLLTFNQKDYYECLLDSRELHRWNIDHSQDIPKGSRIVYKDNDFIGRFKWFIIAAFLFLILQSILIFRLVILNRKQRLMTRQLHDSENKFRELVREDRVLRIGQLTASLSHELNQPLTAILSTAQAGIRFLDSNNPDPELLREILRNIVEDDKRTAAILSSIRGMMKLEKREKEKTNLNDLIQEMVIIFNTEAVAQKLKLEMKLTDEPVFIKADPIQIQQVIHNLMSNAMQAMEKVISDNKKITITETKAGDEVVVSVRDFGHGIEEKIMPKIFRPFITTKTEGLGIGLAISRSIIDDHHGRIWAENKPGGGSEFSFSLKMMKDEK